jgi:hypothetical protein
LLVSKRVYWMLSEDAQPDYHELSASYLKEHTGLTYVLEKENLPSTGNASEKIFLDCSRNWKGRTAKRCSRFFASSL